MRRLKLIIYIAFWTAGVSPVWSQGTPGSNLRHASFVLMQKVHKLDSQTIIPGSLLLETPEKGTKVDTANYTIYNNTLRWHGHIPPEGIKLEAWYRVFPFNFTRPSTRIDPVEWQKQSLNEGLNYVYRPQSGAEAPLLDFRGLDYNGSFARGLSFGNNQDLVLNSRFNLQLAGNLGEDVEILAAITDENIPLQPEGTTRQLQELDKVFIQLKRKQSTLTAGDYELQRPGSHFLNYYKKLQGATAQHVEDLGRLGVLKADASVAISRGQFARQQLPTVEGNQGPYRLQGNRNERFIIVLGGTERVWLDGRRLTRGIEDDYIMDYNRGEITFTNQVLITKDSRVIIEFEYSDQGYQRSLLAGDVYWEGQKHELHLNILSQQDSKNATGAIDLTNQDKRLLAEAGDDPNGALVPAIDSIAEFSPQRASYKLVDTLVCGVNEQVLVFTTNPGEAAYTARFSFVGEGNGHYVEAADALANERVFRYVAPDTQCQPMGDYAPVVQLPAPQAQQMITLGGSYRPDAQSQIGGEVALSRLDLNRFSSIDQEDDLGMAGHVAGRKSFRLGRDSLGWQIDTRANYEYVQKHFRGFNPWRDQEFYRDWSLTNVNGIGEVNAAEEHLVYGGIGLRKAQVFDLGYGLSAFMRDSLYTGIKHLFHLEVDYLGWEVDVRGSLLDARQPGGQNSFFRPNILLAKSFPQTGGWRVGVEGRREKSSRRPSQIDTLSATSFFYDRYRFFVESPSGRSYNLNASFSQRLDYAPVESEFRGSTDAKEFNINGGWQFKNTLRWQGNFSYRNLQIIEAKLTQQEAAETFLGRTDVGLTFFRGAIRTNTTYELGTGQEPAIEFTYVKVAQGEGIYIWLDSLYNNDGVIQPNEMEVAPFPDQADYIRVTTVTNVFLPTNYVNLNQSLQLNPRALWYSKEGWAGFLAKFSSQSSVQINRKTRPGEGVSRFNPFQLNIVDTSLVAVGANIRNVLFFQRADPVWGLELGQLDQREKSVLVTGFESRSLSEQFLRGRLNLGQTWNVQTRITQGVRQNDSEQFEEKRYRLVFYRLEPELSVQPIRGFRAKLLYKLERQENSMGDEGERALANDLGLEITYNRGGKSSIRAQASWVQIQFDGQANSPVGFAMLNGLQPGRNLLWSVNWDRQLARNLLLSLQYEGRQTGNNRVVHVGRAQVAATF